MGLASPYRLYDAFGAQCVQVGANGHDETSEWTRL